MGISENSFRFVLHAAASGVSFEQSATIGRQRVKLDALELSREFQRYGFEVDRAAADELLLRENTFVEPILERLGALRVVSFDASPFEGATVVHDMNTPIPDDYRGQFSAVIESGSLEHIFSFPTAISNCMELVKVGGHLLIITPANNFCGHGFYQFSPELFFRVLSPRNGYAVERAMTCNALSGRRWYEVQDPAQLGRRVEIRSAGPAYLLILARRIEACKPFAEAPQQSDYSRRWEAFDEDSTGVVDGSEASSPMRNRARSWIHRTMPDPVKTFYRRTATLRYYLSLLAPPDWIDRTAFRAVERKRHYAD